MNHKVYKYEQFSIQKDKLLYSININSYKNTSPEQVNLFTLMVNFGYTSISTEQISFTDEQIVRFWDYGKDSVLKNMNLNEYYENFGIAPMFTSKIPTLKTTGAFFSDKFELKVTWINDTSEGKIASSPQSYKRNGLELLGADEEVKGSITPEYFHLYELVDMANTRWARMTKSEKYKLLVELSSIRDRTKFLIPSTLQSTLADLQS